jgi:hypothetical protein
MFKTLLSSTCLASVLFLLPPGPVSIFGTADTAQARQSDEHKGSWVGLDFDDDDDAGDDDDDSGYDDGGDDDDDGGDDDDED